MSNDVALLVVDVQVGMFEESEEVYEGELLLDRIGKLITKARAAGVPVIYVQHNEGPGEPLEADTPKWQIHPAIAPLEGDLVIQKWTPDSFHGTNLQYELENAGIRKLIVTGMQTEMCIDTTCRRAFSLGYDVVLAKDAHSTFNSRHLSAEQIVNHHNAVLRWFADTEESAKIAF